MTTENETPNPDTSNSDSTPAKELSAEEKVKEQENLALALEAVNTSALPENLLKGYTLGIRPAKNECAVLYALVTCQHCIRTQRFLKEHSVPFHVVHVDLFDGAIRANLMKVLRLFNPKGSFPTLVLPSGATVTGFREHKLREAIKQ